MKHHHHGGGWASVHAGLFAARSSGMPGSCSFLLWAVPFLQADIAVLDAKAQPYIDDASLSRN